MENGVAILNYLLQMKDNIRSFFVVFHAATQMVVQRGISDRRVRILCEQGRVDGVIRRGSTWLIPADAKKPLDGCSTRYHQNDNLYAEQLTKIDALKAELDSRRPLWPRESCSGCEK